MYSISKDGLRAIMKLEGFKKSVYRDVAGLLTIGVGHLLTKAELSSGQLQDVDVMWRHGLSDDMVLELLNADVAKFVTGVNNVVTSRLSQAELDTLVSFSFNIGLGNFGKSTLLRKLNAGEHSAVPAELRKWNKAGGKEAKG